MGRQGPQRQAGARRDPRRRREPGQASLRRQGVLPTKIKKRRMRSGKKIKPKDIAIFTRQLATMMKAGVPLAAGLRHRRARQRQPA
jgi:type II secretory pathway component PulF